MQVASSCPRSKVVCVSDFSSYELQLGVHASFWLANLDSGKPFIVIPGKSWSWWFYRSCLSHPPVFPAFGRANHSVFFIGIIFATKRISWPPEALWLVMRANTVCKKERLKSVERDLAQNICGNIFALFLANSPFCLVLCGGNPSSFNPQIHAKTIRETGKDRDNGSDTKCVYIRGWNGFMVLLTFTFLEGNKRGAGKRDGEIID